MALVAFLTLVALAIPVEHLAFSRHPRLIDNEVARRALIEHRDRAQGAVVEDAVAGVNDEL